MKTKPKTKMVRAWAVLRKDGEMLADPTIFYQFGEAGQFSRRFYQVLPCTITYKLPNKKR